MRIIPFIATCDDYHEFQDIVIHFRMAGILMEYKEIGLMNGKYKAEFRQINTLENVGVVE